MRPAFGRRSRVARFLFRQRSLLLDLGFFGLILTAVLVFAPSSYNPYRKDWSRSTFYERSLAPAVLWACGRGFVQPEILDGGARSDNSPQAAPADRRYPYRLTEFRALDDFLFLRAQSFSCEDLPDFQFSGRATGVIATSSPYLLRIIGLVWSLRGISWAALDPLFGLFCGLVAATSYGLFRLAMGRVLSLVGTFLFFPLHLVRLPGLRDYSKAPFLLGALLLFGILLKKAHGRTALLGTSALAGLVIGLGTGFRPDCLIALPPFLVVLSCLPRADGTTARTKWVAAGIFLLAFAVAAGPAILAARSASSDSGRLPFSRYVLQGLANPFTEALGVVDSLYEWAPLYADSWPDFQTRVYAYFKEGNRAPLGSLGREYNSAGNRLTAEVLGLVPADLLTRGYGAVLRIIKAPVLAVLLFVLVGSHRPRLAIAAALLVLYFCGHAMLQFSERHFFYMLFLPLWLVGLAIQLAGSAARGLFDTVRRDAALTPVLMVCQRWWLTSRTRIGALTVGAALLLFVPLYGLRWYQHQRLGELFERYQGAELEPLEPTVTLLDEDRLLVGGLDPSRLTALPTQPSWRLAVAYLVAEFSPDRCDQRSFPVTLRYEHGGAKDFSRTVEVRVDEGGATRLFSPVYSTLASPHPFTGYQFGRTLFLGLELPAGSAGCLDGLYRLPDLGRFPPLLQLQLAGDWRAQRRYQTLLERGGSRDFRRLLSRSVHRWGRIREGLSSSPRSEPGAPTGTA